MNDAQINHMVQAENPTQLGKAAGGGEAPDPMGQDRAEQARGADANSRRGVVRDPGDQDHNSEAEVMPSEARATLRAELSEHGPTHGSTMLRIIGRGDCNIAMLQKLESLAQRPYGVFSVAIKRIEWNGRGNEVNDFMIEIAEVVEAPETDGRDRDELPVPEADNRR